MPYTDKNKQRTAVKEACKRLRDKRSQLRSKGICPYCGHPLNDKVPNEPVKKKESIKIVKPVPIPFKDPVQSNELSRCHKCGALKNVNEFTNGLCPRCRGIF